MSLVMSRAARRTLNEQRTAQDLLMTMRDEFSEDFDIVTRLGGVRAYRRCLACASREIREI
jgi:hypothetical protein